MPKVFRGLKSCEDVSACCLAHFVDRAGVDAVADVHRAAFVAVQFADGELAYPAVCIANENPYVVKQCYLFALVRAAILAFRLAFIVDFMSLK